MSQYQKAGAGSQQIQVMGNYVVQQGVTEERAAEIADERAKKVIAEYSSEAAPLARERIRKLDQLVVEMLSSSEGLDALKDPAYLVALQKAQVGAASTERESDYELLARLLSQRAKQARRTVRASIDKAVQVIDLIDESALQGLTMFWIVGALSPRGESLAEGVTRLEDLLSRLPHDVLPSGRRWLDHLDMLDLVRVEPFKISELKKFGHYFAERWPGFLSVGFEADKLDELRRPCPSGTPNSLRIVEHEFKPGFYRVGYMSSDHVRRSLAGVLPDDDIDFHVDLAKMKANIDVRDEALVPKLHEAIAQSPVLSLVSAWWDEIPGLPHATSSGIAVAYANSCRFHDLSRTIGMAEYLEEII